MHRLLILTLVLLLSGSAHAGGNPDVRMYIDFDPPNYVHEIAPPPYTVVTAYVCMDQLGEGFYFVSFDMQDPSSVCPGVVSPPIWSVLLSSPVSPPPPPWDSPDGVTLGGGWCVTDAVVLVASLEMFYISGSCCIEIVDHGAYPRWVVDCLEPQGVDQYCVLANGSIGGSLCPEGDCGQTPEEPSTWGLVKALYR